MIFYSFDLDPVTLILKLVLNMVKMYYLYIQNEVLGSKTLIIPRIWSLITTIMTYFRPPLPRLTNIAKTVIAY